MRLTKANLIKLLDDFIAELKHNRAIEQMSDDYVGAWYVDGDYLLDRIIDIRLGIGCDASYESEASL